MKLGKICHAFEGTGVYKAKLWLKRPTDGTKSKYAEERELRNIFGDICIKPVKYVRKHKFLAIILGASKASWLAQMPKTIQRKWKKC